MLSLLAIIGIITKASVSSLESSYFSKYSGAPQGHHVIFPIIFPAKGPPPCPLPHIYNISLLYIIYHISLLHPRWDEQCRDTMMTVPPQLTSSLPSFSYPASCHPPPASSFMCFASPRRIVVRTEEVPGLPAKLKANLRRFVLASWHFDLWPTTDLHLLYNFRKMAEYSTQLNLYKVVVSLLVLCLSPSVSISLL